MFYQGPSKTTPGYYCTGTGALVDGRGTRHLQFGGLAIDAAVAGAFLAALAPAALSACLAAVDELEHGHDTALAGHRREVSAPATTRPGRNAATGPSTRTTDWSPAAWKPTGRRPSPRWLPPRPNSHGGRNAARRP